MGESTSILPLVRRLIERHPALHVLVTTGTVTSAQLLAQQLPPSALHQYAPVDLPQVAGAFLDHWRPDLVLWTESEFWPNLIAAIAHRHVPMALINGRISGRTFKRWRRFPGSIRHMLATFTLCLGQTQQDADRLRALGAAKVQYLGNLKSSAPPLAADSDELGRIEAALAGRLRWLAASTHVGEEVIVAAAHVRLLQRDPALLLLLAPRHPERGVEIAVLLRTQGLTVARRSASEPITSATQVYLADTIGELGLWYRVADVVFVGGSISVDGGHNPLEPARLGAAILHGPRMSSFKEIAADMTGLGASRIVATAAELERAAAELLFGDADCKHRMTDAARAYAESQAGTLDRVIQAIEAALPIASVKISTRNE
jgi:3-deoxy-D-manno-octulosonic-acid transferase